MIKKLMILVFGLSVSACGGVKESLGITKDAPDEFSVVRHAPLEIPSNITLPPPRPGQPRPQEQTTTAQAAGVIFGQTTTAGETASTNSAPSGAEASLLKQSGATTADPSIRSTLDQESEELERKNRPVLDKILMKSGHKVESTAETLDPKKEAERLKSNNVPTKELPPEWDKKSSTKE